MYKLNYPVQTAEAIKFWGSAHKCNRAQSIIAFSLDLDNANDNLRRHGYKLFWRERALAAFGAVVNTPSMDTPSFTFYEPKDLYWKVMPIPADLLDGWATSVATSGGG